MRKYSEEKNNWFTNNGENYEFNWPKLASSKDSVKKVEEMDTLEILEDKDLKDLL